MTLFVISISVAVLSSTMYHLFVKSIPPDANPALALIVTYALSLLQCLVLLLFLPLKTSIIDAFRQLNWASFALSFAPVGLEVGFLFAYRSGWNISVAAIFVHATVTLFLVPIGMLMFKEKLSPTNMIGILVCVIGIVMVNIK